MGHPVQGKTLVVFNRFDVSRVFGIAIFVEKIDSYACEMSKLN